MKIKNISIENYRFFKDKQAFNFNTQNILLYGENGSGKTSLYNALVDFFFYYKNDIYSKEKLKENKNIFANTTDEPKIEITFDDNTTINFTKDGLDTDSLKAKIEQVSKSKLFLTYQDIYSLKNIFKKELTYQEFKDVFTILYFDELNNKFKVFEDNLVELREKVEDIDRLTEDYEAIKRLIKQFDETYTYELEAIEKEDPVDKDTIVANVYDTAFYLGANIIDDLEESAFYLEKFLQIYETRFDIDSYALVSRYSEIIDDIKKYTKENDRYDDENIIILNEEIHEGNSYLDDFSTNILMNSLLSKTFIKCEEISSEINGIIYNKLDSSMTKINDILNFLDVNLELKEVTEKPFIGFDINNIFNNKIRNIELNVHISGKSLPNHWSNLNEAKLSALNFAIYLSSVLGKKPDIPILVLDDLLISLDMSNRDRILKLLLDRSGTYFDEDYQILIFTHDRAFYELAKYKIEYQDKDNWNFFELFVDKENSVEKPYLNEKADNEYHEIAKEFFDNRNYAVASNYLRKEVEKLIHEYLGLRTLDGAINTAKIKDNYKKLDGCFLPLLIALKGFEKCKDIPVEVREEKCVLFSEKMINAVESIKNIINEDTFHDINGIKDRILNPQSHYDSSKPLYKKELEDALAIVKELEDFIFTNVD